VRSVRTGGTRGHGCAAYVDALRRRDASEAESRFPTGDKRRDEWSAQANARYPDRQNIASIAPPHSAVIVRAHRPERHQPTGGRGGMAQSVGSQCRICWRMGGYRPSHARPAPPRRQSARPAASVGCGWATGTETPAARDGRGPPALPCVVPGVSVLWFAAAAHRSGAPSRSLTRYSITPPFPRQSGQHQQCTLNHTRRDAGGASIRSDPRRASRGKMQGGEPRNQFTVSRDFSDRIICKAQTVASSPFMRFRALARGADAPSLGPRGSPIQEEKSIRKAVLEKAGCGAQSLIASSVPKTVGSRRFDGHN